MYTVEVTPTDNSVIDESATRGTQLLGFRIVPVLTGGMTFDEAMAGVVMEYFFNGNSSGQVFTKFVGQTFIKVKDSSTQKLVNAAQLRFSAFTAGVAYRVTILEFPGEDIEPDDAATVDSGGNPPSGVTTTIDTLQPLGYVPTLPTDGASISGAKGLRLYIGAAGTWQDGQPILCWRYVDQFGGEWVRCPENDLSVPAGSNALGVGAFIGFPDQGFTVGTPGERILYSPAVGSITGGSPSASLIYEVQE